jgi:hypothetical protein
MTQPMDRYDLIVHAKATGLQDGQLIGIRTRDFSAHA